VEAGGVSEVLFERYLSNAVEDQHWHEQIVDLSRYAGQTVQITLETGPGPNGDFIGDWAGWGMPRIVQPPVGSVCDTNAVVDTRR
jgi:hypothetical protein